MWVFFSKIFKISSLYLILPNYRCSVVNLNPKCLVIVVLALDSNNDINIHIHTLLRPTEIIQTIFIGWRWGYLKTDISVKNSLSFWYVCRSLLYSCGLWSEEAVSVGNTVPPWLLLRSIELNELCSITSSQAAACLSIFYFYGFRDTVGCGDDLFQSLIVL